MSKYLEAKQEFIAWRTKFGYSVCDQIIRDENKRRLQIVDRPARVKRSVSKMKKLYFVQSGKCKICGDQLRTDFKGVELDHIDPNRADFNDIRNLQLLCTGCNREKGALSVMQQTKRYSTTATAILHTENFDD